MDAPTPLPTPSDTDPLAPLRAALPRPASCALGWVESTGSTNADLLQAAKTGALSGPTLLAAARQTSGRGRRGRHWHDDAGSVLCSVAWPFAPRQDIAPLSLAVGVWLAQALQALGATTIRLKWPNDLLLPAADTASGWRKLGGVLIEVADTADARWAVIGFGINLRSPADQPDAAGLATAGVDADRGAVLAASVPALLDGLAGYSANGFGPTLDQWNRLHAWAGQTVAAHDAGQVLFSGTALGLAADGALRVQTPQGEREVRSADVSLRLAGTIALPVR
jgi:BirA family biotin operon repressor/biotin-[acetyl-CoA-carboxylase] ligase